VKDEKGNVETAPIDAKPENDLNPELVKQEQQDTKMSEGSSTQAPVEETPQIIMDMEQPKLQPEEQQISMDIKSELKTETQTAAVAMMDLQTNFDSNEGKEKEKEQEKEKEREKEKEAQEAEKKRKEEKPKKKIVMDNELLRAFQFFDRDGIGYIKSDDLETLFHSLGQNLSHYQVRSLTHKCIDTNTRRLYYKKLVEKEVEISEETITKPTDNTS